ncbi:hypothetical protein ICN49_05665 [Polynucleobacter sp. MWH-Mekk-B1]|jgi:hypothetical protein|uniref:hypothetical protein n=1 Tax=Polynucleobacter finlandensis TaxID=1855894 RepID=UPI001C0C5F87|nr:hypothetical protein [Polynucleobacter finlandensis]MBU3544403.1 hypothetical protein [Polynucleobacter finlandensis]
MNKSSTDCRFFSNADKDCPFYGVNIKDSSAVLWSQYEKGWWKIPVVFSALLMLIQLIIWSHISGAFTFILALSFVVSAGCVYWLTYKLHLERRTTGLNH